MEIYVRFDAVKSGWSIVYFEGSKVIISFSEDYFVFANSANPDEMLHYVEFHLGLHCLQRCIDCT